MSAAPKDLLVHYAAADACVASLGPYILVRCFGEVKPEAVNASVPANRAAVAARPEGAISIVLIDPTTKFPSDEMRRAAVAARKQTNRSCAAYVTIVAGDGFWASTVRGALTAINSLSASSYPTKVFRDVREGVAWAMQHAGPASAEQVARVVRELEAMTPTTTAI